MDIDDVETRVSVLLSAKGDIASLFSKYGDDLKRMKNSRQVEPENILELSRRIALTIRAPKLWQPGHPLDNSFGHAPCPQLEELSGGMLRKCQMTSSSSRGIGIVQEKRKEDTLVEPYKATPVETILSDLGITIQAKSVDILSNAMQVADEQPKKKSRHFDFSFGLSDSEDEEDE